MKNYLVQNLKKFKFKILQTNFFICLENLIYKKFFFILT